MVWSDVLLRGNLPSQQPMVLAVPLRQKEVEGAGAVVSEVKSCITYSNILHNQRG